MIRDSDLVLKALVFGMFCLFATLLCLLTMPSDQRVFTATTTVEEKTYHVTGIAW